MNSTFSLNIFHCDNYPNFLYRHAKIISKQQGWVDRKRKIAQRGLWIWILQQGQEHEKLESTFEKKVEINLEGDECSKCVHLL